MLCYWTVIFNVDAFNFGHVNFDQSTVVRNQHACCATSGLGELCCLTLVQAMCVVASVVYRRTVHYRALRNTVNPSWYIVSLALLSFAVHVMLCPPCFVWLAYAKWDVCLPENDMCFWSALVGAVQFGQHPHVPILPSITHSWSTFICLVSFYGFPESVWAVGNRYRGVIAE